MSAVQENHENIQQLAFETKYITSSEICEDLGVARSVLMNARERGMLPGAILIRKVNFYIWERAAIAPYLDAWRISLKVRRGEV